MTTYNLDTEEQEILDAFDTEAMKPISTAKEEMIKHQEYAAATFKKDKRINIRIASRDLTMIQKLAISEGIPYQTFIASILHKFVDGRYMEKSLIKT